MRTLTLSLALLALSACATPPAPAPTQSAANDQTKAPASNEQICQREYPTTSSTIAVTRCRSKEQVAADQAAAKTTSDSVRDAARVMRDPPGTR